MNYVISDLSLDLKKQFLFAFTLNKTQKKIYMLLPRSCRNEMPPRALPLPCIFHRKQSVHVSVTLVAGVTPKTYACDASVGRVGCIVLIGSGACSSNPNPRTTYATSRTPLSRLFAVWSPNQRNMLQISINKQTVSAL